MNVRIASLCVSAFVTAGCATTEQYDGPGPFDRSADAKSQVTNAIAEAHEYDRNILLVFGANWCLDSRATVELFETHSAISRLLKESFVVERIDVGPTRSGRNADMVGQYHASTNEGIPVLVVLDKSGRLLNDTRVERLDDEDHEHPDRIVGFLEKYSTASEEFK